MQEGLIRLDANNTEADVSSKAKESKNVYRVPDFVKEIDRKPHWLHMLPSMKHLVARFPVE